MDEGPNECNACCTLEAQEPLRSICCIDGVTDWNWCTCAESSYSQNVSTPVCLEWRMESTSHGGPSIPQAHRENLETRPYRLVATPPEWPAAALVAALAGGVLIALEGAGLLYGAVRVYGVVPGPPADDLGGLGFLAVCIGIVTVLLAVYIWFFPTHYVRTGVLLVTLGLLSLACGGGFLIGLGLTVAGGLIAINWRPTPPYCLLPQGVEWCPDCNITVVTTGRVCPHCGFDFEQRQ